MLQLRALRIASIFVIFYIGSVTASLAQDVLTVLTSFNVDGTGGSDPNGLVQGPTEGSNLIFYSTTFAGGPPDGGTVFKVASPAKTVSTLYYFCAQVDCADGSGPSAPLVLGTDGDLYGTTSSGGVTGGACTSGCGTVFKITTEGALTTLYSFTGYSDGSGPAGLVQGADGNFYGTTSAGGANGEGGTAFSVTPTGQMTTLYSFCLLTDCADGRYPRAGLVQGTDGNFYGTTSLGGANERGTAFKITTGGLTTLYNFCSVGGSYCTDGANPYAGLVQATDGNFYGTTFDGGANNTIDCGGTCGTAFQLTPGGALTTLYSFCSLANCADGNAPYAGLIQGADGNFYGTTVSGGATSGNGTAYVITPGGVLTTLYSFCSGSCGDNPEAGLMQGTDGSFYGTTSYGGGTVFKLSAGDDASLTPSTLTFPNTKVGDTSAAKNVTLKNNLTTELTGISYSTTGPFSVSSSTCTTALEAKSSCTISVTFSPTVTGKATGLLSVSDSVDPVPHATSLSGTGTD